MTEHVQCSWDLNVQTQLSHSGCLLVTWYFSFTDTFILTRTAILFSFFAVLKQTRSWLVRAGEGTYQWQSSLLPDLLTILWMCGEPTVYITVLREKRGRNDCFRQLGQ